MSFNPTLLPAILIFEDFSQSSKTYTEIGSGGTVVFGLSNSSLRSTNIATGGTVASGSNDVWIWIRSANTATGGIVVSGLYNSSLRSTNIATGGTVASGSNDVWIRSANIATGGVAVSNDEIICSINSINIGNGGILCSGACNVNVIWQTQSNGHVIIGGESPIYLFTTEFSDGGSSFSFYSSGGVFASGLSKTTIQHVAVIVYVKKTDIPFLTVYDPVAPNYVIEPYPDVELIIVKKKQLTIQAKLRKNTLNSPPPEPESGSVIIKR